MVGFVERRQGQRVDFSGITMVRDGVYEICCMAGNVSEFGILLFPQRQVPTPSPFFHVTFTLPSLTQWIEVEGAIVRETSFYKRVAWGVEFVKVQPDTKRLLHNYVVDFEKQSAQSGPPELTIYVPSPVATSPSKRKSNPTLEPCSRADVPPQSGPSVLTRQADLAAIEQLKVDLASCDETTRRSCQSTPRNNQAVLFPLGSKESSSRHSSNSSCHSSNKKGNQNHNHRN